MVLLCNLFFQFQIIFFANRNRTNCEHRVKAKSSTTTSSSGWWLSNYNNSGSTVLKLSLQYCSTLVTIGSTFFKTVILLDGLVVQILTVNYEQNFFDIRKSCRKLCGLKGSQGLTASCGVPDIFSILDSANFFIVGGYLNPVQNTLSCHNLIRSHNKQYFISIFRMVRFAKKAFVKSTESAIILLFPSAQYEVTSKLLEVFLLRFLPFPSFSLTWFTLVVLE